MKSIRFAAGRSYGAARASVVLAMSPCSSGNASTQRGGYNIWQADAGVVSKSSGVRTFSAAKYNCLWLWMLYLLSLLQRRRTSANLTIPPDCFLPRV